MLVSDKQGWLSFCQTQVALSIGIFKRKAPAYFDVTDIPVKQNLDVALKDVQISWLKLVLRFAD